VIAAALSRMNCSRSSCGVGGSLSALSHLDEKWISFCFGNQTDLNDILCSSGENSKGT